MWRVLGNVLCDLDPKLKDKGQLLNVLVNAASPKAFGIVASNYVGA